MSAHAAGVVHNDVKSSNVLLDDDGAAYLTDFGIAFAGDDRLAGEAVEAGDVRGLALMLWELLTGSPATPGAHIDHRPCPGERGPEPRGADAVGPRRPRCRAAGRPTAGGYPSAAEFVLGWRAATGGPRSAVSRRVRRTSRRGLRAPGRGPPLARRRRRASTRTGGCGRSTRPTPRPSTVATAPSTARRLVATEAVGHRRRIVRIGEELGGARRPRPRAASAGHRRRQ